MDATQQAFSDNLQRSTMGYTTQELTIVVTIIVVAVFVLVAVLLYANRAKLGRMKRNLTR